MSAAGIMRGFSSQRGFSFLEVLLAGSITLVALLAITVTLPIQYTNANQVGEQTRADFLAQHMLEAIRNDGFTTVMRYNGVDTRQSGSFPPDDLLNNPKFRGTANCQDWANAIQVNQAQGSGLPGGYGTIAVDNVGPSLLRVRVSVFWVLATRGTYSVTVETLLTG